jgi:hypothetical protein
VCLVVLMGFWLGRRRDYALYRLLGFAEPAIFAMLCVEWALMCAFPSQVGLIIGIGGLPLDPLVSQVLLVDLARFDAIVLALPGLGYLLLPRRSLLPSLLGK